MNNNFLLPSICCFILSACSQISFENASSTLQEPPHCVPGKKIGVWLDENSDGSKEGEKYLGSFISYSGPLNAADNYNYYSASAHPLVGPTPQGFKSTFFFYDGPDGLSFNFFSNVDAGGSHDNVVEWNLTTHGNTLEDNVLLSDDHLELSQVSSVDGVRDYEGHFHYWSNTDGGVIGPFSGNFEIAVRVINTGDVIDGAFYSAGGDVLALKNGSSAVSSFIVGFEDVITCE